MPPPLLMAPSPTMNACIQNCLNCANECMRTVSYLLGPGSPHSNPTLVNLLLDCAAMCRTTAELMSRGSGSHAAACALCAKMCRDCRIECGKIPQDAQLTACATRCRDCEVSCATMGVG